MPATGQSLADVKTMIYVIGVSYSAEYAIGRVFEWIRGEALTPQDDYARKVLQDYAAFLYTIPWYKYPFQEKLDGLMTISAPTPSPLRTWERDFSLGTEYFIKIGYAELIQKALDAYETLDFAGALSAIWAWIGRLNQRIVEVSPWQLAKDPALRLIQGFDQHGRCLGHASRHHRRHRSLHPMQCQQKPRFTRDARLPTQHPWSRRRAPGSRRHRPGRAGPGKYKPLSRRGVRRSRFNKLYRQDVGHDEIVAALTVLMEHYAKMPRGKLLEPGPESVPRRAPGFPGWRRRGRGGPRRLRRDSPPGGP